MSIATLKSRLAQQRLSGEVHQIATGEIHQSQGDSGEKGGSLDRVVASRFSQSSLGAGESGRIRENQNAILPSASLNAESDCATPGRIGRKLLRPTSCAGAGEIGPAESTPHFPRFSLPSSATVLKHCRCMDCRKWDRRADMCFESGFSRYVPREEYHPRMQRFWSDLGMIRLDAWHYCAFYHGPQISKDIWVWPKHGGAQAVMVGFTNGGQQ